MPAPTVTASLNKPTFSVGETMTLTVNYSDSDSKTGSVTVVVTDEAGNQSSPVTLPYNIVDKSSVSVTDSTGKTFTLVSDTGAVAVYQAVA